MSKRQQQQYSVLKVKLIYATVTILLAGALWQGYQAQYGTTVLYASDSVMETPTPEQVEAKPSLNPEHTPEPVEEYTPTEADVLVAKYSDIYGTTADQRSRLRVVLHCLLSKESVHGANQGQGDNGMAGGPLQFWEETYISYRKIMIKAGLVNQIGSRYNLEDAVETATWAITTGRGNAWGPILRGECTF